MPLDASRAREVFLSDAVSLKPLAAFRIGLAAVLLYQAMLLGEYRQLLLYEGGPVSWALGESLIDPLIPTFSRLLAGAAPLGITSEGLVLIVFGAHVAAVSALLVGFQTRSAALVAWITHVVIVNSTRLFTYGVGSMLTIGLFYCVFMPVSRELIAL